jgi:hypothetical protein
VTAAISKLLHLSFDLCRIVHHLEDSKRGFAEKYEANLFELANFVAVAPSLA